MGIEVYLAALGIEQSTFIPEGIVVKTRARDLRGQRFRSLTAIRCVGKRRGSLIWECVCDCGNKIDVLSPHLIRPGRSSCGCRSNDWRRGRMPWNKGERYRIFGPEDDYANRAAWAKAAIAERGNACEQCGWNLARCDVHHVIPRSRGGRHTLSNAIILCPNCHRLRHERGTSH